MNVETPEPGEHSGEFAFDAGHRQRILVGRAEPLGRLPCERVRARGSDRRVVGCREFSGNCEVTLARHQCGSYARAHFGGARARCDREQRRVGGLDELREFALGRRALVRIRGGKLTEGRGDVGERVWIRTGRNAERNQREQWNDDPTKRHGAKVFQGRAGSVRRCTGSSRMETKR